ncbi:MAG TPA: hypothetical protein VFT98_18675, partial [Myxococcota bacterium]|nr:hypothetical protein [Myxococcota bacterium]
MLPQPMPAVHRNLLAIVGALAAAVVAAAPALADSEPLSVLELFANPTFASPALSDDGQTLAVIHSKGDVQFILTRPIAGGEMKPVTRLDDPQARLNWLRWANPQRLLMSALWRNPDAIGMRSRVTRLFGIDANGKNFDWLGRRWPVYGQLALQPFRQDDIVHWTPDDPETVRIQVQPPYRGNWPRVMRMNVNTGKLHGAFSAKQNVREWIADNEGQVRAGVAYTTDN